MWKLFEFICLSPNSNTLIVEKTYKNDFLNFLKVSTISFGELQETMNILLRNYFEKDF